ncbi:MAG: hypothetical protein KGR19_04825 [Acidobacteria bacterium]|nr:hypothetical protein [Acidobacteriota bacterium]
MRHNRWVPGRRLLLLLVLLLLTLSVLSATRDISRRPTGGGTSTTTAAPPATRPAPAEKPPATERPATTRVTATLPSDRPVRVGLGERVALTVRSDRPDVVLIDELGLRAPVGPGTTGILDFVAGSQGSFAVTLALNDRRIGEVKVAD